jgi:uncharacterized protein
MDNQTHKDIMNRMYKHNDYRRLMEVRAYQSDDATHAKMVIEGKAITFEDPTVLFRYDGIEYIEIIARDALKEADISKAFLKYNHSDDIMAMARTKNGTLQIETRDDGVYIKAELANTTAGRDLFELVKRGDIDKMSFAFTIKDETYDNETHTWTVNRIDTLYDVAAVTHPAYENTVLFARRYGDAEARRITEVETLVLVRKRLIAKLRINMYQLKNNSNRRIET